MVSKETYDARQPHVIGTGNPVDGLNFIGPFPNSASAIEGADHDGRLDADWWIAPLELPEAEGAAAASSDRALEPGKDDPSGILREFVADCLAAGQNDFDEACADLRNVQDWPDLEKTFRRAHACVETLDALRLRLTIDVVYNPN
jgi:hypothetical protein